MRTSELDIYNVGKAHSLFEPTNRALDEMKYIGATKNERLTFQSILG